MRGTQRIPGLERIRLQCERSLECLDALLVSFLGRQQAANLDDRGGVVRGDRQCLVQQLAGVLDLPGPTQCLGPDAQQHGIRQPLARRLVGDGHGRLQVAGGSGACCVLGQRLQTYRPIVRHPHLLFPSCRGPRST
jgi:hypothetical protein